MRQVIAALLDVLAVAHTDSRIQVGNTRVACNPKADEKFLVESFVSGRWVEVTETNSSHTAVASFVSEVERVRRSLR